jgi:hypothetical protein
VASVAAQGGVAIKEKWAKEVKEKWRKGMLCFKALRREPDRGYWHKNGNFVNEERVEIRIRERDAGSSRPTGWLECA